MLLICNDVVKVFKGACLRIMLDVWPLSVLVSFEAKAGFPVSKRRLHLCGSLYKFNMIVLAYNYWVQNRWLDFVAKECERMLLVYLI